MCCYGDAMVSPTRGSCENFLTDKGGNPPIVFVFYLFFVLFCLFFFVFFVCFGKEFS